MSSGLFAARLESLKCQRDIHPDTMLLVNRFFLRGGKWEICQWNSSPLPVFLHFCFRHGKLKQRISNQYPSWERSFYLVWLYCSLHFQTLGNGLHLSISSLPSLSFNFQALIFLFFHSTLGCSWQYKNQRGRPCSISCFAADLVTYFFDPKLTSNLFNMFKLVSRIFHHVLYASDVCSIDQESIFVYFSNWKIIPWHMFVGYTSRFLQRVLL